MIKLKNVSLVFQGGSVAISNITTSVNDGEFVYLVGHSCSGKSSFLKVLYKEYIATEEIEAKTNTLLDLVELNESAYKYPGQLSGGQQTRVSIARALANNPVVLLCDEPTGNLDPDLSIQIVSLLEKINRAGTTVVMATHDSTIVNRRKKRVIELKDGKITRDEQDGSYIVR